MSKDNHYYYRNAVKTIRAALAQKGIKLDWKGGEDYGRVKFPRDASWEGYCPELNRQVMLIEAPFIGTSLANKRVHRILIDCPECRTHNRRRYGRWIPAGRFAQHLAGAAHRRAVDKALSNSPPWRVFVAPVAKDLLRIARDARNWIREENKKDPRDDGEDEGIDVRLQVSKFGTWYLKVGDPSYDTDHHGSWGAASIPRRRPLTKKMARDIAQDLILQCVEDYAQLCEEVEGTDRDGLGAKPRTAAEVAS